MGYLAILIKSRYSFRHASRTASRRSRSQARQIMSRSSSRAIRLIDPAYLVHPKWQSCRGSLCSSLGERPGVLYQIPAAWIYERPPDRFHVEMEAPRKGRRFPDSRYNVWSFPGPRKAPPHLWEISVITRLPDLTAQIAPNHQEPCRRRLSRLRGPRLTLRVYPPKLPAQYQLAGCFDIAQHLRIGSRFKL